MVWAIVVVAIAVLGVGAWAGTGKLGEMPGAVTDRPKAHIPDGPVDETFLKELSLPIAGTGYRRSQVDTFLAAHVAGETIVLGEFDVVRHGYDMQAVDVVLDLMHLSRARRFGGADPLWDAEGKQPYLEREEVLWEGALIMVDRYGMNKALSERMRAVLGSKEQEPFTLEMTAPQRPKRAVQGDLPAG